MLTDITTDLPRSTRLETTWQDSTTQLITSSATSASGYGGIVFV